MYIVWARVGYGKIVAYGPFGSRAEAQAVCAAKQKRTRLWLQYHVAKVEGV